MNVPPYAAHNVIHDMIRNTFGLLARTHRLTVIEHKGSRVFAAHNRPDRARTGSFARGAR